MIPIDVIHKFDHKIPWELKIPILNTNNNVTNITKSTAIVPLRSTKRVDNIFNLDWDTLLQTRKLAVEEVLDQQETQEQVHDLLPQMAQTNLQMEADKPNHPEISTPNADVPEEALSKLQHLLEVKYNAIISKSATDIGRTNLIELDIPTESPPIASKPYSVPLKYWDFIDQEIKQLEEAGIISHSMSNWTSLILVMPKEADLNVSNTKDNKQFNLRLCINYQKLNNRILTSRQIKADGKLGKVVASYPLPTIDNLLAQFKDCKYFSTLDLQSRYYHIKLTPEAAEKMVFISNKGKWKFCLLPFGINLGPSAFSYVSGNVLASCHKFALNYLDNIIIFSKASEEHLEHLEEVFKQLKHPDLKIKCSKCKFFKAKIHYLGYLISVDGVQPLPDKLEAIKKLLAPTNEDELCQFLGITGFYRKFVPFYGDITNCLTKLLRKGTEFQWSKQCNHAFNILKEGNYAKCHLYNTQTPTNLLSYLQMPQAPVTQGSYIRHKTKSWIKLILIAYFSGCFNYTQQLW